MRTCEKGLLGAAFIQWAAVSDSGAVAEAATKQFIASKCSNCSHCAVVDDDAVVRCSCTVAAGD